jgi:hypothetical protein
MTLESKKRRPLLAAIEFLCRISFAWLAFRRRLQSKELLRRLALKPPMTV